MNRRVIAIVEVVIVFGMFFCMPADVADAFIGVHGTLIDCYVPYGFN